MRARATIRYSRWLSLSILLVLLCGALAASHVDGQTYAQQEPMLDTRNALVWTFRSKRFTAAGAEPAVFCDEQVVAKMDNGRYFLLTLEPGVHAIRSTEKAVVVRKSFESGREYFLEVGVSNTIPTWSYKFAVEEASRYRAALAMSDLRPLKTSDIVDTTRVTAPDYANR
jgi:uncharacterized protein DUF2846